MIETSPVVILSEAKNPVAADRWSATSGRAQNPSGGRVPPAASLPVRLVDGLIWLYQKTLSPALTVVAPSCGCRFAPTCSHYARAALREHGLLAGSTLAARRLLKCGPWHPGGLDLVPPRRLSCERVGPSSPTTLPASAVSLAEAPRA